MDWTGLGNIFSEVLLPIFLAFFSGLFGAWFGARFAAQAQSEQRDTEKLNQLRTAVALAASVTGGLLSAKKQQFSELCENYLSLREQILSHLGTPTVEKGDIKVMLDMRKLTGPRLLVPELFEAMKNMDIDGGQNFPQLVALMGAAQNFSSLTRERNEWIDAFYSRSMELSHKEKTYHFLGIPFGSNDRDTTYRDFVIGIKDSLDTGLFHSYSIYQNLAKMLVEFKITYEKKYGKAVPIFLADFSTDMQNGLIPHSTEFPEWSSEPKIAYRPWWKSRSRHSREILDRI